MKNIKTPILLSLLIGLLSFSLVNPNGDSLINDISSAIKKGNASEVAASFAANVELLLPGNEGTYSKTQAEVMLRNFFAGNPPESFTINHQGSSRDGSRYAIGTYKAKDGGSYRTYYLIKKVSDNFKLHQLQFEKQ
jgi:hypothetical protein